MLVTPGSFPIDCGSLGGIVASDGGGRVWLRRRSGGRRGGTDRQQTVRRAFGGLAAQWSLGLSSAQRASWATFAGSSALQSLGCNPRTLGGWQNFLRSNLPRVNVGSRGLPPLVRVLDAPAAAGVGVSPSSITSAQVSGDLIGLAGTFDGATPAISSHLIVYMTPVPETWTHITTFWHLATFVPIGLGVSTFSFFVNTASPGTWVAGAVPAAGTRWRVHLRLSVADGRLSLPLDSLVTWAAL